MRSTTGEISPSLLAQAEWFASKIRNANPEEQKRLLKLFRDNNHTIII